MHQAVEDTDIVRLLCATVLRYCIGILTLSNRFRNRQVCRPEFDILLCSMLQARYRLFLSQFFILFLSLPSVITLIQQKLSSMQTKLFFLVQWRRVRKKREKYPQSEETGSLKPFKVLLNINTSYNIHDIIHIYHIYK